MEPPSACCWALHTCQAHSPSPGVPQFQHLPAFAPPLFPASVLTSEGLQSCEVSEVGCSFQATFLLPSNMLQASFSV